MFDPSKPVLELARASALLGVVLLVGCGDGSSGPTRPPELSSELVETKSRQLVNAERERASVVPTLGRQKELEIVAREHSRAMRRSGVVFHVDPEGRDLESRLRRAGIEFLSAGENVTRVRSARDPAAAAHLALMQSARHRRNILAPRFSAVGIGVAAGDSTYWITQIFVELER